MATSVIPNTEYKIEELRTATEFKYIDKGFGDFTLNSNGYFGLTWPVAPVGYTLMFAGINNWTSISPKAAIAVTALGNIVLGTPSTTVSGLSVRYYYCKNISSST